MKGFCDLPMKGFCDLHGNVWLDKRTEPVEGLKHNQGKLNFNFKSKRKTTLNSSHFLVNYLLIPIA
jgi:hypothetical protein